MVLNSSESELAMQQEEMAIGQNLGLNTLNEKAQGFNQMSGIGCFQESEGVGNEERKMVQKGNCRNLSKGKGTKVWRLRVNRQGKHNRNFSKT